MAITRHEPSKIYSKVVEANGFVFTAGITAGDSKQDAKGQPHDFATITLEVSPVDADRVIVAKDGGHLTALLRHPEDEGRNETALMNKSTLVASTAGKASASAPSSFVEYIVGGGGPGLAKTTTIAELANNPANAH